jgi:hypothetical protein
MSSSPPPLEVGKNYLSREVASDCPVLTKLDPQAQAILNGAPYSVVTYLFRKSKLLGTHLKETMQFE